MTFFFFFAGEKDDLLKQKLFSYKQKQLIEFHASSMCTFSFQSSQSYDNNSFRYSYHITGYLCGPENIALC